MEDEKIERLRERILQCPICMDEYKDPRILPCHHTVCLHCLLDYVRHSSSSGRLFRCPQCRSDICVPRGGVKDFPPNFYVNCIQDELGNKPYFGICDICEREWLVSQYRCVDCDLDICKFCIHEHRLFKHDAGRHVTIMRIEAGNIGTNLTSERSCEHHKDEQIQMYCCACDKAVCVSCVCEFHKKHDTMPLVKKLGIMQKELQFDLDELNANIKNVKKSLGDLGSTREFIKENSDKGVKSIRNQARELTLRIDEIAESNISVVREAERKHMQDIDVYIKELKAFENQLMKGSAFLEDLQEGDVSLELFNCFSKYKKGLEIMKKGVGDRYIQHHVTSFEPGSVRQLSNYQFIKFGSLDVKKKRTIFMQSQESVRVETLKQRLRKIFCFRNFLQLTMFCVVVATLFILIRQFIHSDDIATENILGLAFVLYMTLAGACAFAKS
ncbi:hypothetical protein FSP39_010021 [Pinctada imbricata]|uniref:Uncharacterized protein n=1 Tax=Pinctada imbricata TaxID=66713 RepID=A0AA88YUY4_PINIB|nr:hypothetical protein FSP39_010021 [Pinctada imbricata]